MCISKVKKAIISIIKPTKDSHWVLYDNFIYSVTVDNLYPYIIKKVTTSIHLIR